MRKLIGISAAVLAASALLALPAQAATTSQTGPSRPAAPASATMLAQQPLLAVASVVHQYDRAHPASGFAGVRLDVATRSVDIYWHGAVPAAITGLAGHAVANGIRASVHTAAYSLTQLTQAEHQLVSGFSESGEHFASITPKIDGSGLTVAVPQATGTQATKAVPATSVPVSVTTGALPRQADRFEDTPPFFGGDYMQAAPNAGPACTTGFAVENSNAEQFMLTASHCSPSGIGTWYTGEGSGQLTIGSVAGWAGSEDAMIISTSSEGTVWTGAALNDPNNQTALAVNGGGDPTVGEFDCASGSFSGEQCNVEVVATNQVIQSCDNNGQNCAVYDDIAQAEQQNHTDAAGNGDSGGPVYTVLAGGANARGTITAYDPSNEVTCAGVVQSGRFCSWRIFFPDVLDQMADFGVNLLANG
jgi:hypothetical protein